ncbi:Flp family type IVb pilin [Kineosporia sp. J2-2]|uniref:Flp family type IVb pilin n=1 Tax=Kineosporia corallincola TaxID=2835133 RepID=A0ABS5TKZ1_9ACTN|nr:Flp family type IVb pilin [Kineosporia corallincola]MBT0771029.1 Flp family type IVb pilin [Kineosporia corallincola]
MLSNLRKVTADAKDRGASAVEYGLMVAAIAAVIVAVVFGLGTIVRNTFSDTCDSLSAGVSASGGDTGGECGASAPAPTATN